MRDRLMVTAIQMEDKTLNYEINYIRLRLQNNVPVHFQIVHDSPKSSDERAAHGRLLATKSQLTSLSMKVST
jgi:hypothetical protein